MAARERLGGLADLCAAGTVLMRAVHDVVLVETVGVGQSETEVAELADTVVLAVQPGSGDSLQYMKAGIVEVPDVAVVTKADMGALAERARRDEGALGLRPDPATAGGRRCCWSRRRTSRGSTPRWTPSTATPPLAGTLPATREAQARLWLERWIREEFGRRGAARGRRPARDRRRSQRVSVPLAHAGDRFPGVRQA